MNKTLAMTSLLLLAAALAPPATAQNNGRVARVQGEPAQQRADGDDRQSLRSERGNRYSDDGQRADSDRSNSGRERPRYQANPGQQSQYGGGQNQGQWNNDRNDRDDRNGRDNRYGNDRNDGRHGGNDNRYGNGRNDGRHDGNDNRHGRDNNYRNDHRYDHRNDHRNDYRRHASYRFRAPSHYVYPRGYRYNDWRVGYYLPSPFYGSGYYIDYRNYRLPPPPYGYRWIRVGNDVILVSIRNGLIRDILYNLFY